MDQEKLKVLKLFETMLYVYEDSSYVKPLIKATDKFIEEGKVFNKDRMKKRDNIYIKKNSLNERNSIRHRNHWFICKRWS